MFKVDSPMLRFLTRPVRFVIEFIAGFIGVLVVVGVLLVWRLSMSPVSSSFLTPYVEAGIVDLVPGTQVTIAHSLLAWDNADRSVTLQADGIHMASKDGAPIADVPNLAIRISVLGLFLGRLVPAGLLIEHPQVALVRTKDGTLLFGGMAAAGEGGGDIKGTFRHIIEDLTHAHFTRKLEITQAAFAIHDESTGDNWAVSVPDTVLERHLDGELTGESKIEVTQKNQTALVVLHYKRDTDKQRHNITARFSAINPAFLAGAGSKAAMFDLPLTGEISLGLDNNLRLVSEEADLHGDAGALVYADFWDAPRAVNSLDLKADYDQQTGKLDITRADIDFGGPKLALTITGTAPPTGTISRPSSPACR